VAVLMSRTLNLPPPGISTLSDTSHRRGRGGAPVQDVREARAVLEVLRRLDQGRGGAVWLTMIGWTTRLRRAVHRERLVVDQPDGRDRADGDVDAPMSMPALKNRILGGLVVL
jgi:hypothetical protein